MNDDNESSDMEVRGVTVLDAKQVLRRGRFVLVVPDTLCFEVSEIGRTLRLDFRPKTLRERVAMWRRRYGL